MGRWLTRRELGGLAGTSLLLGLKGVTSAAAPLREPGRVGVARASGPASDAALAPAAARSAVGRAIVAGTGRETAAEAVRSLFGANDTVGIKLNCLGGPRLSPRVELVDALAAMLRELGIPSERIIAFDRSSRELRRAGFPIRKTGGPYLVYGIDNNYDPLPSSSGEIGSCFARLVSTTCTALVSFGVVKDHDLSGVSAAMKNLYGLIHNPNKYHDNNCDPYLADVANHPFVRTKLRLAVLDGVTAQYQGGPAYRPDTTWALGAVVASTDVVAADAWAWRVIDAERRKHGLPSLAEAKRPPRYLATAARYGLGVGDPAKIREVLA
jgi:uncharacterized protein (DUF362 family)